MTLGKSKLSSEKIAPVIDKAMDKESDGKGNATGISLKKGPFDEMDIDETKVNGVVKDGTSAGKRKGRQSLSNRKKGSGATGDDNENPSVSRVRVE